VALLLGSASVRAEEPVFSGPQPGEKLTAFKVLGFSGPQAGKEFEVLDQIKGAPTLLVFVHEITRPAFQLLRPLDLYGAKLAADGLATHFVWLTADRSRTEQFLNNARNSLNFKAPLSISLDGLEGPGNYGLNRKVALTILIAKDNQVVANFAIVQPNETDAPKVLAGVGKLLGKPVPSLEQLRAELGVAMLRPQAQARPPADMTERVQRLEEQLTRLTRQDQEHQIRALTRMAELQKQVDELTDALNEARGKVAKLEGKAAPAAIRKLPPIRIETSEPARGRASNDPQLQQYMRRLIQLSNDETAVQAVAEDMVRWAGNDARKKAELADYCQLVLHLGYGTEAAKRAFQKLAGD
jgi:hypothetical protein